jgi:virginiamycin B lyase
MGSRQAAAAACSKARPALPGSADSPSRSVSRCGISAGVGRLITLVLGVLIVALGAHCGAALIPQYGIPAGASVPEGIVYGPDGAYWFTMYHYNAIGRVTTNGVFGVFPLPTLNPSINSNPYGITVGPDNNIWFTEITSNKIGKLVITNLNTSPIGVAITEYPVLSSNMQPACITAGPDNRLWFTESAGARIGAMTTNGLAVEFTNGITPLVQYYAYQTNQFGAIQTNLIGFQTNYVFGITVGADGNLWFTEATAGQIARITTNGTVTEFPIPLGTNSQPFFVLSDASGALWFTEFTSNKICRVSAVASLTNSDAFNANFSSWFLPTTNAEPYGLVSTRNGAIWFAEFAPAASKVGYLVPNGTNTPTINEFPLAAAGSEPEFLATGPDGSIWFTEAAANAIARVYQPILQITAIGGKPPQVLISWSDSATGFVLQSNTNLATTNWVTVTTPRVLIGTNFVVTNTITGTMFFRLAD